MKHPQITKELLTVEYLQKKKPLVQIAKEIGVPWQTLYWYKDKFNIPTLPISMWLKGKRTSPTTEFKRGQHSSLKTEFKKGSLPWNDGKQTPRRTRKKISENTIKAMQNLSDETKNKMKATQFRKGIVPWNKGKIGVYSQATIKLIRDARLEQIHPKKDTGIERTLFEILGRIGVDFIKHKNIDGICQADAFVKPNLVFFADGDYWHCNPINYPIPKTQAQKKNLERDMKQNAELRKRGYVVIRLWESDFINASSECDERIREIVLEGVGGGF